MTGTRQSRHQTNESASDTGATNTVDGATLYEKDVNWAVVDATRLKLEALGATVAVGEILYQAQTGYSFSYNPSPLTLGAIAYLILFIPVVWFGRWVETRFAWKR